MDKCKHDNTGNCLACYNENIKPDTQDYTQNYFEAIEHIMKPLCGLDIITRPIGRKMELAIQWELSQIEASAYKRGVEEKIDENTSDGYHTFKELYEFRKTYNAALFNEWAKQGKYDVHKSERHHDGEFCFGGGWFIVVATLPTGDISNHYEMKDWDLFNCRVEEKAKEWDGHSAQDVIQRLQALAPNK